jgi:hypothetical protein
MPAKSKKQQMAAGAALAAKRGQRSKSSLKGASRGMYKIDEQSGAAQNGQNQAQRKTDKEEAALICRSFEASRGALTPPFA